jgi:hypothetical protein
LWAFEFARNSKPKNEIAWWRHLKM